MVLMHSVLQAHEKLTLKLVSGKCAWAAGPYSSYEDFEIDVRLVLANCR